MHAGTEENRASIQNAVTGLQDKILWVTRSVVKGHFNISYNA